MQGTPAHGIQPVIGVFLFFLPASNNKSSNDILLYSALRKEEKDGCSIKM